jgi:hypothetical protein
MLQHSAVIFTNWHMHCSIYKLWYSLLSHCFSATQLSATLYRTDDYRRTSKLLSSQNVTKCASEYFLYIKQTNTVITLLLKYWLTIIRQHSYIVTQWNCYTDALEGWNTATQLHFYTDTQLHCYANSVLFHCRIQHLYTSTLLHSYIATLLYF